MSTSLPPSVIDGFENNGVDCFIIGEDVVGVARVNNCFNDGVSVDDIKISVFSILLYSSNWWDDDDDDDDANSDSIGCVAFDVECNIGGGCVVLISMVAVVIFMLLENSPPAAQFLLIAADRAISNILK